MAVTVDSFRQLIATQLEVTQKSKSRFAEEVGISRQMLYDFLSGKKDISSGSLLKLCEVLSIQVLLKPPANTKSDTVKNIRQISDSLDNHD
ncbi:MAG: helix-turn-helix transcriptional regulator [Deinococcota bacterium]